MTTTKPSGFTCKGGAIVGYVEIAGSRSDPEAEQLRKLGVAVSGDTEIARVRIALPVDAVTAFYESVNKDEPGVIVYTKGEGWYLWGQFDEFLKLYNDAKSEFRRNDEL